MARLADAELTLGPLRGIVGLDEIHRCPNLFTALRVLADRPRTPARYHVLGSAAPEPLRQGAESLAGRIAFHELSGLSLVEVGMADMSETARARTQDLQFTLIAPNAAATALYSTELAP